MKKCELCLRDNDGDYGSGRFCSSFCARKFSTNANRLKINEKIKKTAIKNSIENPIVRTKVKTIKCPICSSEFEKWECNRNIYCSRKCYLADKDYKFREKPNSGGYRKNSGRSKCGYYKGIWCQSTYELAYVIYNLEHGIKFERNTEKYKYIKDGIERQYLPDFIESGVIIELKGYYTPDVDLKTSSVNKPIKVLYKRDIQYMIDYVLSKYNIPLVQLYDNYKPKFNYLCFKCKKSFSCDRPKKTNIVFCSRSCAGLHRKAVRIL